MISPRTLSVPRAGNAPAYSRMHDFRRLIAWQKSNAFETRLQPILDRIAKQRPGLADQLERSAGSIAANIAEGCGRETKADFRRFLTMAIGSTTETENHLVRANQRAVITAVELEQLTADCVEVRRIINGLRKSLADAAERRVVSSETKA